MKIDTKSAGICSKHNTPKHACNCVSMETVGSDDTTNVGINQTETSSFGHGSPESGRDEEVVKDDVFSRIRESLPDIEDISHVYNESFEFGELSKKTEGEAKINVHISKDIKLGTIMASVAIVSVNQELSDEPLARFNATVFTHKYDSPTSHQPQDKQKHIYSHFMTRKVASDDELPPGKTMRRKGIATLCIESMEEVLDMLAEKYDQLKYEWIQMTTLLGGLGKIIVDHDWATNNGISKKLIGKKNLGYLPHPLDEQAAAKLIMEGKSDFNEYRDDKLRFVTFYKEKNSSSLEKLFRTDEESVSVAENNGEQGSVVKEMQSKVDLYDDVW